jgi:protein O-GlcNAc transferase
VQAVLVTLIAIAGCSTAQTVPLEQLAHPVPASAAKEYRAAKNALDKGKLEESIAHCQKALKTDPDNASAHNDLGVLYLNDGQTEKARSEFRTAAALQPRMAMAHINESFALLALDLPGEAESAARRALQIAPADRRANLMLGWSLRAQFRYSKEALASLQSAARDYPEAHLAAADVLIHDGSLDGARKEIEAYLASGIDDQKPLAQSWLRLLKME